MYCICYDIDQNDSCCEKELISIENELSKYILISINLYLNNGNIRVELLKDDIKNNKELFDKIYDYIIEDIFISENIMVKNE